MLTIPTIEADYKDLAKNLGYDVKEDIPIKEIIRAICKVLEHQHNWLLVFDNATDEKSLESFLPRGCNGHVIITSRNQEWSRIGKKIDVHVRPRKESVTFLMERTGLDDPDSADMLAETLGDLPLALEQAAAFILISKITFNEYSLYFKEQRKRLWEREKPPTEYHGTVATTWTISFNKINPAGKAILFLCAFLAPDNIPRWLLKKVKDYLQNSTIKDTLDIDEGIASMNTYSLISATETMLSIHRLLQAVIIDQNGRKGKKRMVSPDN